MKFTSQDLRSIADALDALTALRKKQAVQVDSDSTVTVGTSAGNYLWVEWDDRSEQTYDHEYVVGPLGPTEATS